MHGGDFSKEMERNPRSFKVTELKEKLLALGLPTSGTKAELVSRLNAADPTGEWMGNL